MAISQQEETQPMRDRGIISLVADLVSDSARLGAQELSLLRAELGERTNSLVGGLVMLGAAAVFAMIALSLIVETIVGWLSVVLESELAASLLCAAIASALAVALYMIGRSRLNPANLAPRRSTQSLSDDINLFTRRV